MSKRSLLRVASVAVALLCLGLSSVPSEAAGYWRKGTFVMGGGFNFPVSELDDYTNSSGSMMIGGGRHITKTTSAQVEWTHNWLGIDPAVLDRAQAENDSTTFSNAYASEWSVTLNMVRRINPDRDIVPWITGGIGFYKRNVQITEDVLVYYPPYWDPWWGWIDGGWAPGEAITGNREASGFGFNVGVGVDLEIESGASLFLDVRDHQAFLDGVNVTIVPVMAGIRW